MIVRAVATADVRGVFVPKLHSRGYPVSLKPLGSIDDYTSKSPQCRPAVVNLVSDRCTNPDLRPETLAQISSTPAQDDFYGASFERTALQYINREASDGARLVRHF